VWWRTAYGGVRSACARRQRVHVFLLRQECAAHRLAAMPRRHMQYTEEQRRYSGCTQVEAGVQAAEGAWQQLEGTAEVPCSWGAGGAWGQVKMGERAGRKCHALPLPLSF